MQKSAVIQDLCSDILYHPGILSEEIRDHFSISAGLIENDLTKEGCDDWFSHSLAEASLFIREQIIFCSEQIQDKVFFLLIELPDTVH